jgi:hypothetical protein
LHDLLLAQYYREYYYSNVNKKTRNILNWVLIVMMVMLPLRGVMAFAQSTCKMHDQAMEGHGMHMMHMMAEDVQIDADESQNCDCCKGDITCSGDCSIGMSVSFITQSAVMLPALNKTAFNPLVNNNLVFRDLTPPLRPPENLQI